MREERTVILPGETDAELSAILTAMGWAIEHVSLDFAAVRSKLENSVVLVDLRATNRLRDIEAAGSFAANAGLPLLLVMAAEDADETAIQAARPTQFLPAPLDRQQLEWTLQACLESRRRAPADPVAEADPRVRSLEGRDLVTGVADRSIARQWLGELLDAKQSVGMVLIGLSQFEGINREHGRELGDRLLSAAAQRLERVAREQNEGNFLIARPSGREFLIAFGEETSIERLRLSAALLLGAFDDPFAYGSTRLAIVAHAGVVLSDENDSAAGLMKRAELALKTAFRNHASIHWGGEDLEGAVAEWDEEIERDLRQALQQDQIEILMQPQFCVMDGSISGCEALARWQHERYGLLGAETLFRVALRSGFLLPVSRHIQRLALRAAARWPSELDGLRLSINLMPQELGEGDFLSRFEAMLTESGFPAERLTVEITEGGLMTDLDRSVSALKQLRASGIRIAIDDFGTGYSSLAHLKRLPLDYLKMDKDLTQDIAGGERERVVVLAVISLAQSLGLKTIAEGVETDEQLALLADEGCDYFQGYLRSRALSVTGFVAFAKDEVG